MECEPPRCLVWLLFGLVLLASPPAAAEACGGLGRLLGGRGVLPGTESQPLQSGNSQSSVLKAWTHCAHVPKVGVAPGSEAASGYLLRPAWSRRLLQLASGKAVRQDPSPRRLYLERALAGSATATPPQVEAGSGGGASSNKGVIVIIVLVPSFFIIIMVATALAWMCRRTDTLDQTGKPSFNGHVDEAENANRALSFGPWLKSLNGTSIARKAGAPVSTAVELEYSLLQVATNDFSVENLLGEGGFGSVYKAQLDEKSFAAVKKLGEDSGQGEKEFQSEVDLMSKVRHQNLVSLLGFCTNGDDLLLVYEYMQNGSLQDQLHGPTNGSALGWHMRIKIALDAARGLEHLHEHCDPPVIHRDFKSSNILLDANFNAKVSDFGLALPMPSGVKKDTSLQLRGTFGYVAPEYFLTGALTEKSDVYGFGVVLLELLTGRMPVDTSKPIGCQSLVTWATPQLTIRSKLPLLLDPVLRDSMNIKHLYQVAAVAALCVQTEPSYRPLIADVVHSLVPLVPVELGGALRTGDIGPEAKKNAAVHAIM